MLGFSVWLRTGWGGFREQKALKPKPGAKQNATAKMALHRGYLFDWLQGQSKSETGGCFPFAKHLGADFDDGDIIRPAPMKAMHVNLLI